VLNAPYRLHERLLSTKPTNAHALALSGRKLVVDDMKVSTARARASGCIGETAGNGRFDTTIRSLARFDGGR
jgi:hypothetical protein